MKIENIEFIEKDQIWQNETTRYWFHVTIDGENDVVGVSDSNGEIAYIDADGYPLTPEMSRVIEQEVDHTPYIND